MADSKKILIVDDETDCVEFLAAVVESMGGYDVVTAGNGEEAIAKAKSEKPALILMDVNMPKKDGHTAFQELRKGPDTTAIPVIMLSSIAALGDFTRQNPMAVRPKHFLDKPVEPDRLVKLMKQVLSGADEAGPARAKAPTFKVVQRKAE
ncbi:MAG: hypothetical protein A3K19_31960 [Lentisphaerae bacterium RIFOXYB12_FULL_65_16]|nr:MAG: hypothetical protein A3K18_10740 [Lentisphaerae bacterium RIFOXYA12_64_32]OGV88717.1 MAG: hypothetical protein A3K19_31960 [Lentisphaerae bacterium RIFOXYB12_FULL_65_16]